jgi:hypothetical protein
VGLRLGVYLFLWLSAVCWASGWTSISWAGGAKAPKGRLEQGDEIFRSFKSFCPGHGIWVDRARESARSLSSTLNGIKDDPACRSIASSLSNLQSLQGSLDRYALDSYDLDLEMAKRERYELLMQLQAASLDPVLSAQLEASLRDVQIRVGTLETRQDRDKSNLRNRLIAQQSVASVQALLNQALLQQDCFVGKPQIFSDLAALAGSIGAVAVTGGISLGVAAGVDLIGAAVEYSRKAALSNKIRRLNEASIHESFTCALEALSNQWCSAREASTLLNIRSRARSSQDSFYKGIRYLEREVPVLMQWLDRVRSGSRPTNEAEANRQKEIFAKEAAIKAFAPTAFGILGEKRKLLPEGSSPDNQKAKFDLMRQAIQEIITSLNSGASAGGVSVKNPIRDVFTDDELPWILAGLSEAPTRRDCEGCAPYSVHFFGPFQPFRDGEYEGLVYPLDPNIIERRLIYVTTRGEERLARERARVLQVDPRVVLWDAEMPVQVGSIRGVSPMQALERLRSFLAEAEEESMGRNQFEVYRDTQERLNKITEIVEASIRAIDGNRSVPPPENSDEEDEEPDPFPEETPADSLALQALDRIYSEAYLEHGTTFFAGRLRRVLRAELHNWIFDEDRNSLDPVTSAQLLASQDILDEFESFGSTSPALIESDISRALVNSRTTAQAFAEVFSTHLKQSLEFYSRMKIENESDYGVAFTDLCLLLLAVPDWQKTISLRSMPLHLCEGVARQSQFHGGASSYRVTRASFDVAHAEGRACHYRNYVRQELLRRNFEPRPHVALPYVSF